jgi:hypothetical protein
MCFEPVGCLTSARWSASLPFLPSGLGDGGVPIVEEAEGVEGGAAGQGLGGG